jgi:hypothetical protein
MDRFVARQNIERFRRRLAESSDPGLRENLARLLAEAYDQLERAQAPPDLEALESRSNGEAQSEKAGRTRIWWAVEQLYLEAEPGRRLFLRHRLIEEEDRFGRLAQKLDLADAYIEDGVRRIATLEQALGGSRPNEAARLKGDLNLANSREILELFRSYRAQLADQAGRIDL